MTNYKIDAVFELRKFLWQQLQDRQIFDIDDYYADNIGDHISPIIPVQQSGEMANFLSGKKHIVYDKIGMSYEDNWLICNEQILFTIYATDFNDINEIRNYLIDEFRRMDESAKDLNRWDRISDKIKFHSIYVVDISPTEPTDELQGFLSADVILEVKYSRITDGSGRFL